MTARLSRQVSTVEAAALLEVSPDEIAHLVAVGRLQSATSRGLTNPALGSKSRFWSARVLALRAALVAERRLR